MIFTVVGPGALGCLFASAFAKSGSHVWLLDHNLQRAATIQSRGLELQEEDERVICPVQASTSASDIGKSDYVLLCVKSQDTLQAIQRAKPLLGPQTLLIAMQNGIGHHRVLHEALGNRWAVAVTAQGATLTGTGKVKQGGKGLTIAGFTGSADDLLKSQLKSAAVCFKRAGLQMEVHDNIIGPIWKKLLINTGINALTAIYDCPNGELLNRPDALATLKLAVLEAAEVAKAKKILLPDDPVAMTMDVCRATSHNISSMLQDVRKGRHTEIEAINGAVVQEAKNLNISVPVNEELVKAVSALHK